MCFEENPYRGPAGMSASESRSSRFMCPGYRIRGLSPKQSPPWQNVDPKRREWHQLDYWMVNQQTRVNYLRHCGKDNRFAVDSDHSPVSITVCVKRPRHMAATTGGALSGGSGLKGLDYKALRDPSVAARFNACWVSGLSALAPEFMPGRPWPGGMGAETGQISVGAAEMYKKMVSVWKAGARRVLPRRKRSGGRSDWWEWSRATLDPLRDKVTACRLEMREALSKRCPRQTRKSHKKARRVYRAAVKAARQGFLGHLLEKVNPFNTFELFKLATRLQQGLGLQRNPRVRAVALKEDDVRAHFQKIWTIRRDGVDVSVMEQLKQRPLRSDLDCEPSLLEVRDFLKKAKMGVGTADSELPAEFCGTLLKDEAALSILVNLLVKIWRSGTWEGHRRPIHVDRHSLSGWNGWGARKKLRAAREFGLRVAWMQENPKRPGSRSHARYEMYKSATTLGEARNLLRDGSWTEKDACWDLNRGYLKIFPYLILSYLNNLITWMYNFKT